MGHLHGIAILICHRYGAGQQGIVAAGVVGDANQGGTLRQVQLGNILAKVGLGRRAHAVTALAQIDDVQIIFQNLALGVALLKLQRLEDLDDLALDGHLVILRHVLDQLLGDGGAAVGAAACEQAQNRPCGPLPVHALVGVKALVLNGDGGVQQIFRNVAVIHPNPVGLGMQGGQLLILTGVGIQIIEDRILTQIIVVQLHGGLGHDDVLDKHGAIAAHKGRCQQAH